MSFVRLGRQVADILNVREKDAPIGSLGVARDNIALHPKPQYGLEGFQNWPRSVAEINLPQAASVDRFKSHQLGDNASTVRGLEGHSKRTKGNTLMA